MNLSTPGLCLHHQLPEFTQTHVHWVSDAIQPSYPLSSPFPPALNLSQHQGLFKWVSSLHQMAKALDFQLQHQSFQWTPRTDLLYDELVGSSCSPRDSQESFFCNTTVQKHQFFGTQLFLWVNLASILLFFYYLNLEFMIIIIINIIINNIIIIIIIYSLLTTKINRSKIKVMKFIWHKDGMVWMLVSLQYPYAEILMPNMTVLGDKAFGT